MDIVELRRKPHLSASSVNDYIDCGLSYKFGRIDRVPRPFIADALEYGTTIHRVLADFYQGKLLGSPVDLKELLELFEHYWSEAADENPDIRYAEGKDFETYLMAGRELLTVYYNKLPRDDFRVLAIEEGFTFNLEGLETPLIGAMDLVEEDESGTIIITDWKTAGRSYSNDEADKSFQLTVYNMAALANGFAGRNILLRFDCLVKTKTPKFEQYYTTRSDEDFERARRKILQVADGISKGVFIPNDGHWKCKGCAFAEHCDKWFRGEVT
ncbi:RecB family exonuclease [Thermodesulfobacteriota bacterium]